MKIAPEELAAVQQADRLEQPLAALEGQLAALGTALHQQDAVAIDEAASRLHLALAAAVDHFGRAARTGGVPAPLRQRLAHAGGQVAAQREALARATASLDRAIDVLLPRVTSNTLYAATGGNERPGSQGGALLA